VYAPGACEACEGVGYEGGVGLFEVLVTEGGTLVPAARMMDDAVVKLAAGDTGLGEVRTVLGQALDCLEP